MGNESLKYISKRYQIPIDDTVKILLSHSKKIGFQLIAFDGISYTLHSDIVKLIKNTETFIECLEISSLDVNVMTREEYFRLLLKTSDFDGVSSI